MKPLNCIFGFPFHGMRPFRASHMNSNFGNARLGLAQLPAKVAGILRIKVASDRRGN